MKITSIVAATVAALSASASAATNLRFEQAVVHPRKLQVEDVCDVCDICDENDGCNFELFWPAACLLCEAGEIGIPDYICTACDTCDPDGGLDPDNIPLGCDVDAAFTVACIAW